MLQRGPYSLPTSTNREEEYVADTNADLVSSNPVASMSGMPLAQAPAPSTSVAQAPAPSTSVAQAPNPIVAQTPSTPKPIVPRPTYIIRSIPMPAAAADIINRVPQYTYLKGRDLYKAIKDIPDWQQMQELQPFFGVLDIAMAYLHREEGIEFGPIDLHHARKRLQ